MVVNHAIREVRHTYRYVIVAGRLDCLSGPLDSLGERACATQSKLLSPSSRRVDSLAAELAAGVCLISWSDTIVRGQLSLATPLRRCLENISLVASLARHH